MAKDRNKNEEMPRSGDVRNSDRNFSGVFQGVEAALWHAFDGISWSRMHRIKGRKLGEVFVYKWRENYLARQVAVPPLLQASFVIIFVIGVIV